MRQKPIKTYRVTFEISGRTNVPKHTIAAALALYEKELKDTDHLTEIPSAREIQVEEIECSSVEVYRGAKLKRQEVEPDGVYTLSSTGCNLWLLISEYGCRWGTAFSTIQKTLDYLKQSEWVVLNTGNEQSGDHGSWYGSTEL